MTTRTIHIVFDAPAWIRNRLVTVEESNPGIEIGDWVERPDGRYALAVEIPDTDSLEQRAGDLTDENERLQRWIDDLQSGMYINCVYCGHRYGPNDGVTDTMRNALQAHVERCPKHPLAQLRRRVQALLTADDAGDAQGVDQNIEALRVMVGTVADPTA